MSAKYRRRVGRRYREGLSLEDLMALNIGPIGSVLGPEGYVTRWSLPPDHPALDDLRASWAEYGATIEDAPTTWAYHEFGPPQEMT